VGFGVFTNDFEAFNLVFQDNAAKILRQQQVGAAAQYQQRPGLHLGPRQQLAQLVGRGKAGKIAGLHVEAEGVVGAEGNVFFELHGRKGRAVARTLRASAVGI